MAIEVFNRQETKFLIDSDIYNEIQENLLAHMEADEYNKAHEFYTISNIYYDTKDNTLIRNSISKPKYKEKLRLRGYGVPSQDSKVYLEIKKKYCGQVNKRRITLGLKEAYDFVSKGVKPEAEDYMKKQISNEIEYILELYDLEPKVYVAYDRKAMFCTEDHDLRITFDTNIRTRRRDLKLESGNYGEQLLDKGQWIMEIKTGKSMPVWLTSLLSEKKIYKNSFSKYGKEYEKLLIENNKLKGEKKLCLNQFSIQPQMLQL